MNEELYSIFNKAWKSYSKIVLKGEVGELKEFLDLIRRGGATVKYSVKKNNIMLAPQFYETENKIKDMKAVDFNKTFEPLSINEIKDIDSIVEAIQERMFYTGNLVFGNSYYVEASTAIFDSTYVWNSSDIYNTKISLYSERIRNSDNIFGCSWGGEFSFAMDLNEAGKVKRAFSSFAVEVSSDVYYSAGIISSQEVMFSFGIRNKHNVIGNVQYSRDKYYKIKEKLLEEIRTELSRNNEIPLLFEILKNSKPEDLNKPEINEIRRGDINVEEKKVIDRAFSSTSKVLLGNSVENIDSVKESLTKRTPSLYYAVSQYTGNRIVVHDYFINLMERAVEFDYIFDLSEENKMEISSFENSYRKLKSTMVLPDESRQGRNTNLYESIIPVWSSDAYRTIAPIRSRVVAYCYWPTEVEYGFGCSTVLNSNSIINAYSSKEITRAFEVDNCRSCSDIYFAHNCEGINNGMFVFNLKGKRNIIGNSEYERETYLRVKESLLEQIHEGFSRNKLKYDIYNIIK